MRIFLTGGTGFIGSHLLKQALATGHDVIALRRQGSHPRIHLEQQPVWLDGSLTNDWSEALASCEAFIHLAAYGVAEGANDWERCFQTNVIDSIHLWKQGILAGIRRFLIVGSCFEYGLNGERYDLIPVSCPLEPTTAYGASKAAASTAALALAVEKHLKLVVARPFHVYGPGEDPRRFWPSLIQASEKGIDFPMTQGRQVRDFQYVSETANQLLNWTENSSIEYGKPLVVNLGTGSPLSLLEFATDQWETRNSKGKLLQGKIKYRANEVFRYVPLVTPCKDQSMIRVSAHSLISQEAV